MAQKVDSTERAPMVCQARAAAQVRGGGDRDVVESIAPMTAAADPFPLTARRLIQRLIR
ncbi:MAG: hypothetical protein ACR2P7_06155 [bacterium]